MVGKNFSAQYCFCRHWYLLLEVYLQIDFGEMPTALLNSILALFGYSRLSGLAALRNGRHFRTAYTVYLALAGVTSCITYRFAEYTDRLYESAYIDGAGAWQKFKYITIPLLRPVTVYILTISIYGGLAMFLESFMLFTETAHRAAQDLPYRIPVSPWMGTANIGYGSAIGLILLVITLSINFIMLKYAGLLRE